MEFTDWALLNLSKAFPRVFRNPVQTQELQEDSDIETPPTGGRSSEPDHGDNSFGIQGQALSYDFPKEFLDVLGHLAVYNNDVSYAIENIVGLGNTEHHIAFDEKVSESQAKEMMSHLKAKESKWYAYGGGINSLKNDLLAQIAISGVISSEIVPRLDLTGIKSIIKVKPSSVEFVYDKEKDAYLAGQRIKNVNHLSNDDVGGLRMLNPITYKYIALRRYSESPYGVPPFLSAVEGLGIQRSMLNNFSHIMKKMGMLGFVSVLLNAPAQKQGETPEQYSKRAEAYLKSALPEIDKTISKGYVVGFKGKHEIDLKGVSSEATGAKGMYELNEQNIMSGLKQDPAMLGRNFSTTETFGRVILAKLSSQIANYQQVLASFLEEVYKLELLLAGYKVDRVDVWFEKPMLSDQSKEEEARTKKINNLRALWVDGIITQDQYAQEMGYDKAASPLDLDSPDDGNDIDDGDTGNGDETDVDDDGGDETDTDTEENAKKARLKLTKGRDEFPYMFDKYPEHIEGLSLAANDGFLDPKLERKLRNYNRQTQAEYRKAVTKTSQEIANALLKMPKGASQQEVVDKVFSVLYSKWGDNFTKQQRKVIARYVGSVYRTFRKDKSIFEGMAGKIPDATFNVQDARTIKHFEKSDEFYLGRFISDESTRKKITAYVKDAYINDGTPIGNNKEAFNDFRRRFKGVLNGEDHKIRRVIDTTVNKMRNYASVAYMNQLDVEEFEVRGITDTRQCDWCKNAQGKRFRVADAYSSIERETEASIDDVAEIKPFLVSGVSPDQVSNLKGEDLQKLGFDAPPYHPGCRDVVLAVL